MLKSLFIIVLFACTALFGGEITIALVESENYAIKELLCEFNKQYPDIKVKILEKNGLKTNRHVVYALDELALFSNKKRDYNKGMKLLKESEIAKIFILNPSSSPYGASAIESMKKEKVYEDVKQKIFYVDSLSRLKLDTLEEGEIVFIAKSLLHTPNMAQFKKDSEWIEICSKLYTPINQNMVIVENGENEKEVKLFYDFILSENAKQILKDFGYSTEW